MHDFLLKEVEHFSMTRTKGSPVFSEGSIVKEKLLKVSVEIFRYFSSFLQNISLISFTLVYFLQMLFYNFLCLSFQQSAATLFR